MSEPKSTNHAGLAHLAAALRPAFRCPTTPDAVSELYGDVVDAIDGHRPLDPAEAALRAVIMLRNAIESTTGARPVLPAGVTIDVDDCDPDIGLHLALYGVETMLDHMGWRARHAA